MRHGTNRISNNHRVLSSFEVSFVCLSFSFSFPEMGVNFTCKDLTEQKYKGNLS